MSEDNRNLFGKLLNQWPGALGLALVAFGLWIIRQVHQNGQHSGSRAGLGFIAAGIALVAYWALSHKNDNYNF